MRQARVVGGLLGMLGLAGCGVEPPAAAVEVELTVKGGAHPGTFGAQSKQAGCTDGLAGPGSWSVQLTEWGGAKEGLRSLQLMLPARDTPEQFYLGLVFGDFFTGTVHEIETRTDAAEQHGRGRATLRRIQDGATVAVEGTTKDSVAIVATITCRDRQTTKGRVP